MMLSKDCVPTITKPSRITKSSATLIDNIFISKKLQKQYKSGLIINDSSDHLPCFNVLSNVMSSLKEPVKVESRKLNTDALNKIRHDLSMTNWECIKSMNVNSSFEYFHDKLMTSLNMHAPVKTITIRKSKPDEPWVTNGLKRCIHKQQSLYKNTLTPGCSEANHAKYVEYKKILAKTKRYCKTTYYKTKCVELKNSTKKLWSLINIAIKKTADKTCIIDCIKSGNLTKFKVDGFI